MAQEELEDLKAQLAQTQQALDRANAIIQWMESSSFWKLRLAFLKLRQKLPFSFRRSRLSSVDTIATSAVDPDYFVWQQKNSPRPADLQKLSETIELLTHRPLISMIMTVCNASEAFLSETIASVIEQIYPDWELCIAADSTVPQVREILKLYQTRDRRIKVTLPESSNSALQLATGEFVALLDQADLLTPDALYEIALLVNRHPQADMIYSDEDSVDENGHLKGPFFKPDWCPDSFLSRMYTHRLGVYRRSLVDAIGGFRQGFEGSQDYDLGLRLTEKTDQIFHIPKILYHRRNHNRAIRCHTAQQALEEALKRRGEPGHVICPEAYPGCYIVRYDLRESKQVTIVIPTRDLGAVLDRCLTSIFDKTTYPNYEVLVIDNGSTEAATFSVFEHWNKQEPERFRCQRLDIPFNFSKLNNDAVEQSQGEYLLFLNNDTEVITPDWITAMAEQAQRIQIGAVGVRLLYPDGTIQHAGIVGGIGGVVGHSHKYYPGDHPGYFSQIQTVNNYAAVTAACLMCRREVFIEVGGFEEALAIAFNDIDFCFKLLEKGYRNIYLPHVALYHYESKSRGYEDTPEKQARFHQEILYLQNKWKYLLENDPCYSPHLTRDREDYSLKI